MGVSGRFIMAFLFAFQVHAQDELSGSDKYWLRQTHAQYTEVWSGRGTLVYSVRHPGREQLIENLLTQMEREEHRAYFPEQGPDTLELAFDKRADLIRLDGTWTTLYHADSPGGESRRRERKNSVWDGEELRQLNQSSSGKIVAIRSSQGRALPVQRTLEFPLLSVPAKGPLPQVIVRDTVRIERVRDAVDDSGGKAVRRFRILIGADWEVIDIDQEQGFSIVRRESPPFRGYPYRRVTSIVNKEFATGIWYPVHWKRDLYHRDTNELLSTTSLIALDLSVNMTIPASHFDLRFPAEASVADRRSEEVLSEEYAKAVGSELAALREEENGEGNEGRSVRIGLAFIVILAAAAGVILLRRKVR